MHFWKELCVKTEPLYCEERDCLVILGRSRVSIVNNSSQCISTSVDYVGRGVGVGTIGVVGQGSSAVGESWRTVHPTVRNRDSRRNHCRVGAGGGESHGHEGEKGEQLE